MQNGGQKVRSVIRSTCQESNYLIQHGIMQLEPKIDPPIIKPTLDIPDKNCEDRTFPKVNWANCNFSGADLSEALLKGAILHNATSQVQIYMTPT